MEEGEDEKSATPDPQHKEEKQTPTGTSIHGHCNKHRQVHPYMVIVTNTDRYTHTWSLVETPTGTPIHGHWWKHRQVHPYMVIVTNTDRYTHTWSLLQTPTGTPIHGHW